MAIEKIDRVQGISGWDQMDPQTRSNFYLKKHQTNPVEVSPIYQSTIQTLNPVMEKVDSVSSVSSAKNKNKGFTDKVKDWFSDKWEWIKDKWNSFLEYVGIRTPSIGSVEKERTKTAKLTERNSPFDVEDDFKYIDIATMDPLRVMLSILVRQGELREEQALLIQQKVLQSQDDLKKIHEERTKINAELALISKREGVLEKIGIAITVGQVLTGILATGTTVAFAATIATGGALTPVLVVTGVLTGVVAGATAFNTWYKADTTEKMEKLQGEMLAKTASRDELQFQLKIDVKDMKKVLTAIGGHSELGSSLLSAQYGK